MERYEEKRGTTREGYLLRGPSGYYTEPMERRRVQKLFKDLPAEDGVGMYGFRHYFASNALGNGIPITDVAEWMGHKSIEETYRTYRHLMPGSITKAARILDTGLRPQRSLPGLPSGLGRSGTTWAQVVETVYGRPRQSIVGALWQVRASQSEGVGVVGDRRMTAPVIDRGSAEEHPWWASARSHEMQPHRSVRLVMQFVFQRCPRRRCICDHSHDGRRPKRLNTEASFAALCGGTTANTMRSLVRGLYGERRIQERKASKRASLLVDGRGSHAAASRSPGPDCVRADCRAFPVVLQRYSLGR
ncbi:tyrosine-type recombinase/integrase [Streptomyces sp. NPDC000931]|uniref:tyrosine-type recombinase/integrase n=1 Tax=Streptomyces sp. NPDC000931 TaxID=3154372 RepID=UPI00331773BD